MDFLHRTGTDTHANGEAKAGSSTKFVVGQYVPTPPSGQSGVAVAPCELGRGLFAFRAFSPGETVLWFSGKVVDFTEVVLRGETAGNPLQVDLDSFIDVEHLGLFVNHSCEPNVGLRDSLRLVALRAIAIGEEIRYDYSTEMLGTNWKMICRCGAAGCRGVIKDFDLLPPSIQAERLRQGNVQPYIVRQLTARSLPES
jgi:hypothetical protein